MSYWPSRNLSYLMEAKMEGNCQAAHGQGSNQYSLLATSKQELPLKEQMCQRGCSEVSSQCLVSYCCRKSGRLPIRFVNWYKLILLSQLPCRTRWDIWSWPGSWKTLWDSPHCHLAQVWQYGSIRGRVSMNSPSAEHRLGHSLWFCAELVKEYGCTREDILCFLVRCMPVGDNSYTRRETWLPSLEVERIKLDQAGLLRPD